MAELANAHDSRQELYLRYSRRSMLLVLALVLVLGALSLVTALQPALGSAWAVRAGWALAVAIVLSIGFLQRTLRGGRWNPNAPEVRAIMHDEWRGAAMDRAMRFTLVTVLAAQVPLGLAFAHLPGLRAAMAMAAATTTLGVAALVTLFLYFGRDVRDDG